MREYYIRREGDEDSSGPYDLDQIASLIEAGKLDQNAYYYDIESENWETISSNKEMMDTLFPKKRKLSLRSQAEREAEEAGDAPPPVPSADSAAQDAGAAEPGDGGGSYTTETSAPSDTPPPTPAPKKPSRKSKKQKAEKPEKLEVKHMLALAEGRDEERGGKTPRERQAAIAFFGLRSLTVFFIFSILAMCFIQQDLIMKANAIDMVKDPYIIIAIFDLVMTVFLILQVTEIYPLLRFRAAIGAGLLSVFFASSEDYELLGANLCLMLAIYLCSAMMKMRIVIIATIFGLLGIAGYLYVFFG